MVDAHDRVEEAEPPAEKIVLQFAGGEAADAQILLLVLLAVEDLHVVALARSLAPGQVQVHAIEVGLRLGLAGELGRSTPLPSRSKVFFVSGTSMKKPTWRPFMFSGSMKRKRAKPRAALLERRREEVVVAAAGLKNLEPEIGRRQPLGVQVVRRVVDRYRNPAVPHIALAELQPARPIAVSVADGRLVATVNPWKLGKFFWASASQW